MSKGFTTIELLIASTIALMVIAAVYILSFGDQSMILGGETNQEATLKTQQLLEWEGAHAQQDFNLVNPTSTTDGMYTKGVSVELLPDFVTKLVTASTTWRGDHGQSLIVHISTLVTNLENPNSPDTCNSALSGDWSHPQVRSTTISSLMSTSSSFSISDVDAYKGKLYVAVASTTYKTDPTFFVIDATDPANPVLRGKLNNNTAAKGGIAGVRIAEDFVHGTLYAFAASPYTSQFQVYDVTNPANPSIIKTMQITAGSGVGSSVFFRDWYVYLGLKSSPAGAAFNIIDVHDPANPVWKSGYSVGSGIEKILIKGDYAYLATDNNSRELVILNVHNPTTPTAAGIYDAVGPNGSGFGRSVYMVGPRLYFGRTWVFNTSNAPELYALDVSDSANPSLLGMRDVGQNSTNPYGVYGVIARDSLAFVLTKTSSGGQLLILDTTDPTQLASVTPVATAVLPGGGVTVDCEGNTLYIGSNDAGGNGNLSIVTPGP